MSPDSVPSPQPIAPGQCLPHRKEIREWLLPLVERSTRRALALLAVDLALLAEEFAALSPGQRLLQRA